MYLKINNQVAQLRMPCDIEHKLVWPRHYIFWITILSPDVASKY